MPDDASKASSPSAPPHNGRAASDASVEAPRVAGDKAVAAPSPSKSQKRGLLGAFFSRRRDKASAAKAPTTAEEVSPFLSARRYVEDRVYAETRSKHQFMVVSLILAVALAMALSGLVYLSSTSRVEPFMIVYSADDGQLLYKGAVEPLGSVPDIVTQAHLGSVLEGLRTVYTDRRATSKDFQAAYRYVLRGSEGDAFLRDYYERTGENPVALVGDLQRSIVEMEVTKIAGTRSWNLQWVERTARSAGRVTQSVWQGSFSVQHVKTSDRDKLEANPTGLYIDGASWQQVSSKVLSGAASAASPSRNTS